MSREFSLKQRTKKELVEIILQQDNKIENDVHKKMWDALKVIILAELAKDSERRDKKGLGESAKEMYDNFACVEEWVFGKMEELEDVADTDDLDKMVQGGAQDNINKYQTRNKEEHKFLADLHNCFETLNLNELKNSIIDLFHQRDSLLVENFKNDKYKFAIAELKKLETFVNSDRWYVEDISAFKVLEFIDQQIKELKEKGIEIC